MTRTLLAVALLAAFSRGAEPPLDYPDHTDLSYTLDRNGKKTPIRTPADWQVRREHVTANLARAMGPLPNVRVRTRKGYYPLAPL